MHGGCHHADGLIEIKGGLAAYQETGAEIGLAHFQTFHVEALARAGETLEALRVVDETIDLMEKNDNRWHEAEVYRLKGELLVAMRSRAGEAENWLLRAVQAARRQRALWPELRARMALARRHDGASGDEALADLLAVTERLTERRDTADAREAAAILRSRWPRPPPPAGAQAARSSPPCWWHPG
jgi:predicted ATPase